jgi:hypothetical protein
MRISTSLCQVPGPRHDLCKRCQQAPMSLIKQVDLLEVMIESKQEEAHS